MSHAESPDLSSPLTVPEAARVLHCSTRQVRRLIDAGLLKATKLMSPYSRKITAQSRYRVDAASIYAYLGLEPVKPKKSSRNDPCRDPRNVLAMVRLGIAPPS